MPTSPATPESPVEIRTVGHSNRSAAALIEILACHQVEQLVDVRAYPRSRRHPQFSRQTLERALAEVNIEYVWWGDSLGGFRKPRADSVHTALSEAGFRGFADYMATAVFTDTLEALIDLAAARRITVMCAEADYRSCHRRFISDALILRAVRVLHLTGIGKALEHELNPCLGDARDRPVYNRNVQGDLFA